MIHLRSTLALSALATFAVFAQPPGPPRDGAIMFHGGPAEGFMFGEAKVMAEAGFDGKVVKGAPYSAQAVTETTQVLANGTHITRKNTSLIIRDSEGRTRREETLSSVGPWATDGQAHTMVFINDPVSQNNYVLDVAKHSASKMPAHPTMVRRGTPSGDTGSTTDAVIVKRRAEGMARKQEAIANVKTETLGTQAIAGVSAVGTRRTHTIPAGQIGNDQPINMVSETWYSQDLQMVVMSKHSDPRNGDTTYTLTNIQRAEPDPSLFTVPADFTMQDHAKREMHVFVRSTDQ